jgi:cytochrome P450
MTRDGGERDAARWSDAFVAGGLALAAALILPAASGTPERSRQAATFWAAAAVVAAAAATFPRMGASAVLRSRWRAFWTSGLAILAVHLALGGASLRRPWTYGWTAAALAAWWAVDVFLAWKGEFDRASTALGRAALHVAVGIFLVVAALHGAGDPVAPSWPIWGVVAAAAVGLWRYAVEGPAGSDAAPPPRGRSGLPVLGEALAFTADNHGFFTSRVARFGRVFRTSLFGEPVAALAGPTAFRALVESADLTREGANPRQVRELLLRDCLPLIDPPEHTRRKVIILQALTGPALDGYLPVIERTAREHLLKWEAEGAFAWNPACREMGAALASRFLLGEEPEGGAGSLRSTLDEFVAGFTAAPIALPWTAYGRALAARDALIGRIRAATERRRGSDPASCVLSALLDPGGPDGSRLDDGQIEREMLHLLFAAYGGIHVVLTHLALILAREPGLKERARAEVDRVCPTGDVGAATLPKLVFLERLSLELRRYFPINASTFFSRLNSPLRAEGVEVPAGWLAVGAIHATLRDSEAFPEPGRFDPDRFETTTPACPHFVPHGGGPPEGHRCPGETFITALVQVFAALLLRDCDWTLPPQDLELDRGLFPLPRSGLVVELKRRAAVATPGSSSEMEGRR